MATPGPFTSGLGWLLPGAASLGVGLYFCLSDGWRYVIDARLLFGHGYVLFAFTPVIFGAFGVIAAWRWGRRGFFFALATGLSCDAAQSTIGPYIGAGVVNLFTTNYALSPLFWALGLAVCWRLMRPAKLKIVSGWSLGMMALWLLLTHSQAWLGTEVIVEPVTEVSWIVCAARSVSL